MCQSSSSRKWEAGHRKLENKNTMREGGRGVCCRRNSEWGHKSPGIKVVRVQLHQKCTGERRRAREGVRRAGTRERKERKRERGRKRGGETSSIVVQRTRTASAEEINCSRRSKTNLSFYRSRIYRVQRHSQHCLPTRDWLRYRSMVNNRLQEQQQSARFRSLFIENSVFNGQHGKKRKKRSTFNYVRTSDRHACGLQSWKMSSVTHVTLFKFAQAWASTKNVHSSPRSSWNNIKKAIKVRWAKKKIEYLLTSESILVYAEWLGKLDACHYDRYTGNQIFKQLYPLECILGRILPDNVRINVKPRVSLVRANKQVIKMRTKMKRLIIITLCHHR